MFHEGKELPNDPGRLIIYIGITNKNKMVAAKKRAVDKCIP